MSPVDHARNEKMAMRRWTACAELTYLMALLIFNIGCCDHCADLLSLTVSRDGRLAASLCGEYSACVWDTSNGKLIHKIETEKVLFSAVALSPTADLLATGFEDGTVSVWEWRTGRRIAVLQNDLPTDRVFSEAFSPNGEELATAGLGSPVRVWNAKTGMLIRKLSDSGTPFQGCWWQESRLAGRSMPAGRGSWNKTCLAYSLAYSPDGKTIAVGSKLWLRLWDATSGAVIRTFPGAAEVGGLTFSPEGALLTSLREDGSVTIWNASTGAQLRRLQASRLPLRAVAFSPGGQILAASGWEGNIYVWDWPGGTEARKISASRGAVNWLFFSADGADIVSGGRDDNLIAVWQISTGIQLRQISCLSTVSP